MKRRFRRDPYTREPRDPLEWIARLAGRSAFRVPTEGRATRPPLSDADVAHALGGCPDPLGQAMALAIACCRQDLWPQVEPLAMPRWIEVLAAGPDRHLVAGRLALRARLILVDAFRDLVEPGRAMSWATAAELLRMRVSDYRRLHRQAGGLLDSAARLAARDCATRLFAERGGPLPPVPAPTARRRRRPEPAAATTEPSPPATPQPRPRVYGLLRLRRE